MFDTKLDMPFGLGTDALSGATADEHASPKLRWRLYQDEIERTAKGFEEAGLLSLHYVQVQKDQEEEEEERGSSWTKLVINPRIFSKHISLLSELWKCDADVSNLITLIRESSVSHAQRIAERVEQLWAFSTEDQPESCPISSGSMKSFTKFLQLHGHIRYPSLTLTPNGEIYAQWKRGRSLFGIQFLSEWDVKFVIFTPNPDHPEKTSRMAGSDTVDRVYENLDRAYAISGWVSE